MSSALKMTSLVNAIKMLSESKKGDSKSKHTKAMDRITIHTSYYKYRCTDVAGSWYQELCFVVCHPAAAKISASSPFSAATTAFTSNHKRS